MYLCPGGHTDITDLNPLETAIYKWINVDELSKGTNYSKVIGKIEKILNNYKK